MKTFAKRAALTTSLLFTALICCGIVYIDNIKHYWQFSSGFIRLIVNTNAQASITIDTNTLAVGINTNNTARSFVVQGRQPATNSSGNGTSAATSGQIAIVGGTGGQTVEAGSASGGAGGTITITGGIGVIPPLATTNATGSAGGNLNFTGGAGGTGAQVATNASTGGNAGDLNFGGGAGGVPTGTASTNTVGGRGGSVNFTAGSGGLPSVGWARKGGIGGGFTFTAGAGQNSIRTNGGAGGTISFSAGNSGNVSTTPGNSGTPGNITFSAGTAGSAAAGGNPSPGGVVEILAGGGSTGDTNSNGGDIFLVGGPPGSGAKAGDVIVGRNAAAQSRGGLMVGPALGGAVSITNILGGAASLDFPSTAAGTVSDLPITVTGVVSNNCAISLSVPWESASGGGGFVTFNSNDTIFVRFVNNQLVAAIDPNPGTFTVVAFRIR